LWNINEHEQPVSDREMQESFQRLAEVLMKTRENTEQISLPRINHKVSDPELETAFRKTAKVMFPEETEKESG